jgi:hypothetical protein
LDGTDIDGTREVAVRDRQVRIHRQQSIDAEIDSVRKSLRAYTIEHRALLDKRRSLSTANSNLFFSIRSDNSAIVNNTRKSRKIHTKSVKDEKSLEMLDKMYANASEDVRNLSNTIRENEDAALKLEEI